MFIIERLDGKWFNGFVSAHPGTQPRGKIEAKFDPSRASVISEKELTETLNDLQKVGVEGYTVHRCIPTRRGIS